MDLIMDLPPVNGYDSILVMVDQGLSKGVISSPCAETITWEGIAELLQDNLFKRFGLPDRIIPDRDPQFAARAFHELLKLLNIMSSLSTAYHPQMEGATEQVNQEIEAYLSIYCIAHPEDWLKSLSTLEFTYNNRRHADQTHTPFELILGDNPIAIPLTFIHTKYLIIKEKMKQLLHKREEALAAHELARTRMANWKQWKFTPFERGQKVWLDTWNFKTGHHKNIIPKCEGPFEIEATLGPVTYWLKLPESWKIHNVFHANSNLTLTPTPHSCKFSSILTEISLLDTETPISPIPHVDLIKYYDQMFPTLESYKNFMDCQLGIWEHDLQVKYFNSLYCHQQATTNSIKILCDQAQKLLEEANWLQERK